MGADLNRIINSDEVQSVLNPAMKKPKVFPKKRNPLKCMDALEKLNPYAVAVRRAEALAFEARKGKKDETIARRRAKDVERKKLKEQNQKFYEESKKQGNVCEDGFNL